MSRAKMLLVEDDPALLELLEYRFQQQGHEVLSTGDGDEALLRAEDDAPDIIILDWMIEGTSGIEVCRRLRRNRKTAHIPIIMLTARETEDDRIRGLETGADDYITKPFSARELLARVTAVLRRARPTLAGEIITGGDITLDSKTFSVTRAGHSLKLGPTEYRLLQFFMENPQRVFSRNQLLDKVWGTGSDVELRTVDVHIRRLRKALDVKGCDDPIRTVRSAGYAFEPTGEA